jgi:hypothetical protein
LSFLTPSYASFVDPSRRTTCFNEAPSYEENAKTLFLSALDDLNKLVASGWRGTICLPPVSSANGPSFLDEGERLIDFEKNNFLPEIAVAAVMKRSEIFSFLSSMNLGQ